MHQPETEALHGGVDCVVICTDHSAFDWNLLVTSGVPIVDSRNALRAFSSPNIVRLSGRVTKTTDVHGAVIEKLLS